MRFFDPACGCGNFLIIAYRELRTLEMEVIRELGELSFSRIDVDQFSGVEIGEFPARIAETALWMMDQSGAPSVKRAIHARAVPP